MSFVYFNPSTFSLFLFCGKLPFTFYLNFHITFLLLPFHISPLFFPSFHGKKKGNTLSLSLSQPLFFPTNSFFFIVDLIVMSHLFFFMVNLYKFLCIFRCFGISSPNYNFFLYIFQWTNL